MSRIRLEESGDAAVVLDLESGTLSRVGGSGVAICRDLASGQTPAEAARKLAQRAGISEERAKSDVEALWSAISAPALVVHAPTPVAFRRTELGFEMSYRDEPVLALDPSGKSASLIRASVDSATLLRFALPHLLALRGQPVLHASAVRWNQAVLAISGQTSSGKSTVAGLLSGGAPLSDDLVFLRIDSKGVAVAIDAEARARRWTEEAGARTVELSDEQLEEILGPPHLPLAELWLLDPLDRGGDAIERRPLERLEALSSVVVGGFGETGDPGVWERMFALARAVAEHVPVARVRVPASLEALSGALSASRPPRT